MTFTLGSVVEILDGLGTVARWFGWLVVAISLQA
jgi:hypothetical protein